MALLEALLLLRCLKVTTLCHCLSLWGGVISCTRCLLPCRVCRPPELALQRKAWEDPRSATILTRVCGNHVYVDKGRGEEEEAVYETKGDRQTDTAYAAAAVTSHLGFSTPCVAIVNRGGMEAPRMQREETKGRWWVCAGRRPDTWWTVGPTTNL